MSTSNGFCPADCLVLDQLGMLALIGVCPLAADLVPLALPPAVAEWI